MSSFIDQMIALRDGVAPISGVFGVPTYRSLILRRRVMPPGGNAIVTTFIEITPKPIIEKMTPRLGSAFQSVGLVIESDDYQAEGVSRIYTHDELVDTSISYFVDGVLNEAKTVLVGGVECDFVGLLESTLTWSLALRRKPDDR